MKTSKHTPGPWEIAFMDDDDGGIVMVHREIPNQIAQGIANVYGWTMGTLDQQPERMANAALIAAAPDLLRERDELREALDRSDAMLDACIDQNETIGSLPWKLIEDVETFRAELRALLAKVKP